MDPSQTDMLTATRQLDCRELLFVVLLKCGTEFGYKAGFFDREGFNICE